jgi:hypothetical protein
VAGAVEYQKRESLPRWLHSRRPRGKRHCNRLNSWLKSVLLFCSFFVFHGHHRLRAADLDRRSRSPLGSCGSQRVELALAIVVCAQQAKSWELRAAMSMARLWGDRGKQVEARDPLAPVLGWFTEGSTRSI